jgi:hypothetical protein
MHHGYNWKLTEERLRALVPAADANRIIAASKARKPNEWAECIERFPLNKRGTVWVQSVQFYGGEHFGEPYHFVAEIRHTTTDSAFSACVNRFPVARAVVRRQIAFTY